MRQEELEERDIAGRPQLAGKADRRIRRADPAKHERLALRGLGQVVVVADDADAAGRAARAAAADAGVGNVVAQARLEHAEALGNAHGAAVAVGEVDHAAAALVDGAGALGQQRDADQSEIADQGVVGDAIEHRLLLARADLALRQVFRPPFAAVVVDDLSSALIKAQHGERRNQYGRRQQERRGAFEERLHPEPEIQADAAVDPGDRHDREHQPDPVRRRDPVQKKHLRIELLMSVQRLAEPHADDVGDDQHRHAEAEHELQRLDRLPAELPAFVQRPDAERGMHQACGVEQDRDREELPERGVADRRRPPAPPSRRCRAHG